MDNETSTPEQDTKSRRSAALLAALGLTLITGGAVAGLVYDLTIGENNSQTLTQIGTIATLGLGGLLALAGARNNDK